MVGPKQAAKLVDVFLQIRKGQRDLLEGQYQMNAKLDVLIKLILFLIVLGGGVGTAAWLGWLGH